MEDDIGAAFSAIEPAFAKSGIPTPELDQNHSWYSMDPWEKFIASTLERAGVKMEMLKQPAGDMSTNPPLSAVQIVSDDVLKEQLRVSELPDIQFVGYEDMHGLQVKLNGAYSWRVTVSDKKPTHTKKVAGTSRAHRSSAADTQTIILNHCIHEIATELEDGELGTMAVWSRNITINILFNVDELTGKTELKADFPELQQRRIDVGFVNQHLSVMQVHAIRT